jgi:hypothetical protein
LIWHENEGAVQPKVVPANMLIQERFLKVWRVQKTDDSKSFGRHVNMRYSSIDPRHAQHPRRLAKTTIATELRF